MSDLRLAGGDVSAEVEDRRSRFVCLLRRVDSEDAARAAVAEARRAHPAARHHCSAFVLAAEGTTTPVERSSDDGEPAGTAGTPMLEVLRGSGLADVVAVVSRYFGGTKLGTGGLVRAYGDAVRAALERAPLVRRELLPTWAVELGLADAGRVEAELRSRGLTILDAAHGADGVRLVLVARSDVGPDVAALTAGRGRTARAGTAAVERRVRGVERPG